MLKYYVSSFIKNLRGYNKEMKIINFNIKKIAI